MECARRHKALVSERELTKRATRRGALTSPDEPRNGTKGKRDASANANVTANTNAAAKAQLLHLDGAKAAAVAERGRRGEGKGKAREQPAQRELEWMAQSSRVPSEQAALKSPRSQAQAEPERKLNEHAARERKLGMQNGRSARLEAARSELTAELARRKRAAVEEAVAPPGVAAAALDDPALTRAVQAAMVSELEHRVSARMRATQAEILLAVQQRGGH